MVLPTRSAQQDVIDELVWGRVSSFWSTSLDPSDRDALSKVYEGMFKVLDAEYVRLLEIDDAKSVVACPAFTQRRWLRLDLNRYAELRDWLRFLNGLESPLAPGSDSGAASELNNSLDCQPGTSHLKHWHISFPFFVDPLRSDPARRRLDLGYPIEASLVQAYRTTIDAAGRRIGTKLAPGEGFTLLADGTSIEFTSAVAGDIIECTVGLDLSSSAYQGLRPAVYDITNRASATVLTLPGNLGTNLPAHVLITRRPSVDSGASTSNNSVFSSERIFVPYTGDSSGAMWIGNLRLQLPFALAPDDLVQVFTVERGADDAAHEHLEADLTLDVGNATPSGTASVTLPFFMPLGLFGKVGHFGQVLQVFAGGNLLSPDEYRVDRPANTIAFRIPLTFTQRLRLSFRVSNEKRADPALLDILHIHHNCVLHIAATEKVYDYFDDGGIFDDEADPSPNFDSQTATDIVTIDRTIDASSARVWVDGVLYSNDGDYFIGFTDGKTSIKFFRTVEGKTIDVLYRTAGALFTYGGSDVFGAEQSYLLSQQALANVFSDLNNLVTAFTALYGTSLTNIAALLEAATVAAAGGNPLLTLFYDEFPAYNGIDIKSPARADQPQDTRNLESAATRLVSIPVLVDHVHNPTVALIEGQDFQVRDGALLSSQDLTAPRGEGDETPGVWWCPLVMLDEKLLARNFGSLLGIDEPSSETLRGALVSAFMLRFRGPTVQAVTDAAASLLGAPVFRQDGKVQSVAPRVLSRVITVASDEGEDQQIVEVAADATVPAVGQVVVAGMSLTTPLVYNEVPTIVWWLDGQLVVQEGFAGTAAGDVLRILLEDPANPGSDPRWELFNVTTVASKNTASGAQTTISFDRVSPMTPVSGSPVQVIRPAGPPHARISGTVASVDDLVEYVVQTDAEEVVVPAHIRITVQVNDYVYRGQPVSSAMVSLLDDVSHPEWQWQSADDARRFLRLGSASSAVVVDRRTASVVPGANGYALMTLTPSYDLPPRGSTVEVASGGSTTVFTVVGRNLGQLVVSPDVPAGISGAAVVNTTSVRTGLLASAFLEHPKASSRPTAVLAADHRTGTTALQLSSTAAFPPAGSVTIRLNPAGIAEVEYFAKSGTQLFDLVWPASDEVVDLPAGAVVEVLWEYASRRPHPAFASLVQSRVEVGATDLTNEATVDQLYNLFRRSTTVLETAAVNRPDLLQQILVDAAPAGQSIVIHHQQIVDETFRWAPGDSCSATDSLAPFNLSMSGTLGGLGLAEFSVAAEGTAPLAYLWWTDEPGAVFSDPTGSETDIQFVTDGDHTVTVVVSNAFGSAVATYDINIPGWFPPSNIQIAGPTSVTGIAEYTVSADGTAPLSFLWETDDPGAMITEPTASETQIQFSASGNYTITVTVANAFGTVVTPYAVSALMNPFAMLCEDLEDMLCEDGEPMTTEEAP